SLIANFIMVGLMLTVTHQVRRPRSQASPEEYASLDSEATQALPVLADTGAPRPDPSAFTPTSPPAPEEGAP
ncbi:MAG: hypothetical protein ACK5LS_10505, partial [Propioniciclava sp.]